MKKVTLLIELEYDDSVMHNDDPESIDWFDNKILSGEKGLLSLYSGEIGDHIGSVKVIGNTVRRGQN